MAQSFFSSVRQPIQGMLLALLSDDNFKEAVTYRLYTGQSFSVADGHTVNTYDEYALTAVRMKHNLDSIKQSNSPVEIGDLLFLFAGDGFPEGASLKDTLVDADGNTLGIKGIDPVFDLAMVVTITGAK